MPITFQKSKSLKEVCTLGIGGPASFYCEIHTIEEMQEALAVCQSQNLKFFILGKGSNCFFDDDGFNGAILHNKIDFFHSDSGSFYVGAGYSFSLLGTQTAKLGFGGLEFAAGIPASVGGAIFMNAGANGQETSTFLNSVDYVDEFGELKCFKKDELNFSYRNSSFQRLKGAIVGATFKLSPCSDSRNKQIAIIKHRQKSQPYKDKSAGCIFKNPEGNFAGKLIEISGLKGFQLGGAKVSDVHANFLINAGDASAKDFLALMEYVKKEILTKTGIQLQSEVCYVPRDRISS